MGGLITKPSMIPPQKWSKKPPILENVHAMSEEELRSRMPKTAYREREATRLSKDYAGTVLGG